MENNEMNNELETNVTPVTPTEEVPVENPVDQVLPEAPVEAQLDSSAPVIAEETPTANKEKKPPFIAIGVVVLLLLAGVVVASIFGLKSLKDKEDKPDTKYTNKTTTTTKAMSPETDPGHSSDNDWDDEDDYDDDDYYDYDDDDYDYGDDDYDDWDDEDWEDEEDEVKDYQEINFKTYKPIDTSSKISLKIATQGETIVKIDERYLDYDNQKEIYRLKEGTLTKEYYDSDKNHKTETILKNVLESYIFKSECYNKDYLVSITNDYKLYIGNTSMLPDYKSKQILYTEETTKCGLEHVIYVKTFDNKIINIKTGYEMREDVHQLIGGTNYSYITTSRDIYINNKKQNAKALFIFKEKDEIKYIVDEDKNYYYVALNELTKNEELVKDSKKVDNVFYDSNTQTYLLALSDGSFKKIKEVN